MVDSVLPSRSGNVSAALGVPEPDVELAKADLAIRIQRLSEQRRLQIEEAAALLKVPTSELPALFAGRLATCSLDQLVRLLTWLGDDIEITIRPRLQRTKRGVLRVLQAAAVERPDDFEPVRLGGASRVSAAQSPATQADVPAEKGKASTAIHARAIATRDEKQLLNKHAVEKMTSLDITTIYRKMAAGTFPQPVRIGRRRVAWRTSDIMRWQGDLPVGTERADWMPNGGVPRGSGARRHVGRK